MIWRTGIKRHTCGHKFALEELLKHEVVVHRLCHDLGDVGVPELDEGEAAGSAGLLASTETKVGNAAELKINEVQIIPEVWQSIKEQNFTAKSCNEYYNSVPCTHEPSQKSWGEGRG